MKILAIIRSAALNVRSILLLLCVCAWAGCAALPADDTQIAYPKNIIILFADGVASTQWEYGRYASSVLRQQSFATTDIVFKQGVLGLASTYPHGAFVTDSAAAGSAMSTGFKVVNGAISITPDGKPVRTAMEVAKASGKRIGLVTTATVYDATPAAFSVHAKSRTESQNIVDQYLALEPDVLLGGGAEYFLPAPGGKRKDGKDVIAAFRAKGWQVARNSAELKSASGPKLLGLFSDDDMDFEIDRDAAKEPNTEEMAAAALKALSQSNANGFVLLVENENTDTAGHANDAAALLRALWAFDDAVKVALEYQRSHPDTLILITGDHETGGFSPTYALKDLSSLASSNRFTVGEAQLKMLSRITMSFNMVKEKLGDKPACPALDELLAKHFPGFTLDKDLRELVLTGRPLERNTSYLPQNTLARMVARQAGFYWGTSGHTPEPVVIGALGPGAQLFRGYQDNTDFGKSLHRLISGR
jgi:alkaline phosphatase